jgi:hypothetical protein
MLVDFHSRAAPVSYVGPLGAGEWGGSSRFLPSGLNFNFFKNGRNGEKCGAASIVICQWVSSFQLIFFVSVLPPLH